MSLDKPSILIEQEDIALRVEELAHRISKDYQGKNLVVICVLKGAFVFCSDLIRKIDLPVKLEFIELSSYKEHKISSGEVKVKLDIDSSLLGKDILIVEDIVDSGLTMKFLLNHLEMRKVRSTKIASLLYKPTKLKHEVNIDYLGFEIEDKFVVGYGLDYAGRYRELPYIGVLNAGN